ncbi:MAG: serine/threonine-protein kinase [Myxococcota bacterium]
MANLRVGSYEVVDRYAVGGVAEIYRCRDVRSGDVVALKRMKPEAARDASVRRGFFREADLARMMSHRNLVHCHETSREQGKEWAVYDFVDGPDLERILTRALDRRVKIPVDFSLHIIREVLDGLHFAHMLGGSDGRSLGFVHRDLSPRNVFVAYDGRVRVGDLGCATLTLIEPLPPDVVGSPGYLSPEQARGEPLDHRSDVYAVGVVLYELLVGARAFDVAGKKDAKVLELHKKGKMKAVPSSLPAPLRAIIERACQVDPEKRYATAAEMRDAVDADLRTRNSSVSELAIAALTRNLFREEYQVSRLPGSPLAF